MLGHIAVIQARDTGNSRRNVEVGFERKFRNHITRTGWVERRDLKCLSDLWIDRLDGQGCQYLR